MAFPTNNTLLDDFNRSDQSPPGGPWASAGVFNASTDLSVSSNRLASSVLNRGGYLSTDYGPDVEIQATLTVASAGADISIYVRGSSFGGSSPTMYRFDHWGNSFGGFWRIYRVSGGSNTTLATNSSGPTMAAGDKIGIEVIGDSLKMFHYTSGSWTQIVSATNTVITSAGKVGVLIGPSDVRLDDLRGGAPVTTVTHEGSASLSGSSGLAVAASAERSGQAAPSGASTLAVTASVELGGATALSGNSALAVAGLKLLHGQVALSGDSTLTVAAHDPLILGSALLSGASNLIVAGELLIRDIPMPRSRRLASTRSGRLVSTSG